MRSFVLAAILLSIGVAALVLIGLNALAGPYSEAAVRELDTMYGVLGWGKYLAALLLLWLADRAVLWREHLGWKRAALLWSPLLFFVACSYFQWVVLGDARIDYLQRHGRWDGGSPGAVLFMAFVYPLAFAAAAANALWVQRRQRRLTAVGLRRDA